LIPSSPTKVIKPEGKLSMKVLNTSVVTEVANSLTFFSEISDIKFSRIVPLNI
jgi:hypothetical protein